MNALLLYVRFLCPTATFGVLIWQHLLVSVVQTPTIAERSPAASQLFRHFSVISFSITVLVEHFACTGAFTEEDYPKDMVLCALLQFQV